MLSDVKVMEATALLALSANCGFTRNVFAPDECPSNMIDVDGTTLNVVSTFCYFGDMLSAGGGCDSAIAARCCSAWCRFRKLFPIRGNSFRTRAKVYSSCVRLTMLHGSETWGPNISDLQRLQRNDHS